MLYDDDDSFSANVLDYDQDAFETYVSDCKGEGFTVEAEDEEGYYSAFDAEGYKIELSFYESLQEMDVYVVRPVANDPITWPTAGVGSLLPVPASLTGEVDGESSSYYSCTVTHTTMEDFRAYEDACIAAGFNVDYHKYDSSFVAKNANESDLAISYEGFDTMTVTVTCESGSPDASASGIPAQDDSGSGEADASDSSSDTSGSNASASGEVTPAFKETMDSYEAFFDSYVEFMKNYSENGYPTSMMTDYLNMMTQYSDCMEKLEAIDESTLTAADDAYYLEVTARIEQKLLSVIS